MPLEKNTNLICIAEIAGPHGIRGGVKLKLYTDDPEGLKEYSPLLDESGTCQFHIESLTVTPKAVIVHFKGVKDRNAAELLKGTGLYVHLDRLPQPEADEFYHADLIDAVIINEQGTVLGQVTGVHNFGAGDIIEFLSTDRKPVCIPFHHDYVLEVDVENKKITVGDIQGFY